MAVYFTYSIASLHHTSMFIGGIGGIVVIKNVEMVAASTRNSLDVLLLLSQGRNVAKL